MTFALGILFSVTAVSGCDKEDPNKPIMPSKPSEPDEPEEPAKPEEPSEPTGPFEALTERYLNVVNYLGNIENTHPKVLYFENGWRGYKYWMAYTPYPLANYSAENPCIAVSNDGYNWSLPEGAPNPIDPKPDYGYNSDTHLVYNEKTDELEIWWRDVIKDEHRDSFLRKISKNGIDWSEEERLLDFSGPYDWRVSPAVFIEDDRYVCYYSDGKIVKKIVSGKGCDLSEWSEPEIIPVLPTDLRCWHLDAIPTETPGVHELLMNCYNRDESSNAQSIYYALYDSNSGNAVTPQLVASPKEDKGTIYSRLYRSSLVKIDGYYRSYLSGIDAKRHRYLSVTEGPTPTDMRGWKAMQK